MSEEDPATPLRSGPLIGAAMAVVVIFAVAMMLAGSSGRGARPPAVATEPQATLPDVDPGAFAGDRLERFERLAAIGNSHVLYALTPGGAEAGARRTARFRETFEKAADRTGQDADTLEAMAMLESAGRPEVIAGDDPKAASGLMQILPETGSGLLGMRVDLGRSQSLTRSIARNRRKGRSRTVKRLQAKRRRVDERFDPAKAATAAGRYLRIARDRFGRQDLAAVSYHMGMGNLENVISAFVRPGDASGPIGEVVDRHDLSWGQIFFATTPRRNARAHRILRKLSDDSATYYWRVLAAAQIMTLLRDDTDELRQLSRLHRNKSTAEEVFHPPSTTDAFADPQELAAAWDDGELVPVPDNPKLGLRRSSQMGELAGRLDQSRRLYRGLRPAALAVLLYIAREVRLTTGRPESLVVTSSVRDRRYQALLVRRTAEATRGYSLHTTGWSFDIRRSYRSRAQGRAFQAVLDRLKSQAVLDFAPEPGAIHVTVSDEGARFLPLLDDE
ncbi:MAG: transglycosylase SLT domain-containing protein [Solirubrobacterales bacterium]